MISFNKKAHDNKLLAGKMLEIYKLNTAIHS